MTIRSALPAFLSMVIICVGDQRFKVTPKSLLQKSRDARPALHFPNQQQPAPEGHFLTNSELDPIISVSCLKAKQVNPAVICDNSTVALADGRYAGRVRDINAGNYPNYADGVCNSFGEFFCDPNAALAHGEGAKLAAELKKLREKHVVTCGGQYPDAVDPLRYQPFYLSVIIAKNWPVAESDPESLQQFGQIVDAQWNTDRLFNGATIPNARCPNTAVLIILPDARQAYLSSDSCEYICATRGGPEIITATLAGLDRGDAFDAAMAGIKTAYKALAVIPQRSMAPVVSAHGSEESEQQQATAALPVYNFVLRILFGIAVILLLSSISIAILVLCISPGFIAKSRRK